MTTLRIVTRNPNPEPTNRSPPKLTLVSNRVDREREEEEERAHFEKVKAELTRGGGLVSRRFEWCENWRDILEEWDEIMWVLPEREEELRKEREREEWRRAAALGAMLAEEERRFKTDPAFRNWFTEKARRGAEELADDNDASNPNDN